MPPLGGIEEEMDRFPRRGRGVQLSRTRKQGLCLIRAKMTMLDHVSVNVASTCQVFGEGKESGPSTRHLYSHSAIF